MSALPCPPRAALVAHPLALGEKHRDAPLRRLRHALDQRPVDLLRAARAEGRAELGRHLARLGDQQHARGVAVEPMDEHRPFAVLVGERLQHAVDVALRARAALHREAVGLVEHDDVAVLEQGHRPDRLGVLRVGAPRRGRLRRRSFSGGTRTASPELEPGRDLGALARDPHLALAHDLHQMRLRQVGKPAAEPAVEPHAGLVLADVVDGRPFRSPPPRRRPPCHLFRMQRLIAQRRNARKGGAFASRESDSLWLSSPRFAGMT